MGVLEEEERKKIKENFEEKIVKNFHSLLKNKNLHI